jgi:citrate synthase
LINIDSTMQQTSAGGASASLSAAEAARVLGVKTQTIYAYASRGWLRRIGTGKRRLYLLEDVERLQLRQRARSGHGPVAAAALSFGEPVLDTRITGIDPERGPLYRGQAAVDLAAAGLSFEAVAELLWSGQSPTEPPAWPAVPAPRAGFGAARSCLEELLRALPLLWLGAHEQPLRTSERELALGRRVLRTLALLLVAPAQRRAQGSIAQLLAATCSGVARRAAEAAIDSALIVLADHELNASSFAARIAASTDAGLLACLTAALATLSGPRHGGACDRVEALLDEAATLRRPSDIAQQRALRGDDVPGFGHPLYPQGDPRARLLLERAQVLASQSSRGARRVGSAFDLARSMARQGLPPTVDFGLVVMTRALGMRKGSAALLFALGRSAGWIAHVMEQRSSEAVLRPRARYLGA